MLLKPRALMASSTSKLFLGLNPGRSIPGACVYLRPASSSWPGWAVPSTHCQGHHPEDHPEDHHPLGRKRSQKLELKRPATCPLPLACRFCRATRSSQTASTFQGCATISCLICFTFFYPSGARFITSTSSSTLHIYMYMYGRILPYTPGAIWHPKHSLAPSPLLTTAYMANPSGIFTL
jgi:hypothetical protein